MSMKRITKLVLVALLMYPPSSIIPQNTDNQIEYTNDYSDINHNKMTYFNKSVLSC